VKSAVLVVAFGLALTVSAEAQVWGVKGNDTGGIIPWTPENGRVYRQIAADNCAVYRKYARITSVRRVYGDYVAYECRWRPTRRVYYRGVETE
jgi:hypothetical protein